MFVEFVLAFILSIGVQLAHKATCTGGGGLTRHCPSCAGRRMAETAAHLVEQVIPWVPTRQWVVSVPITLRYWMAALTPLMAQVHNDYSPHDPSV